MEDYKIQSLIQCTLENYNNRKVVIWGKCDTGDTIANILAAQHQIKTEYFIDSNVNLHNGLTVKSVLAIDQNSKAIYVVIPLNRYHDAIIKQLTGFGYKAGDDYAYIAHKPVIVPGEQATGYYADAFGNKIIGAMGNGRIIFLGYNATITIGAAAAVGGEVDLHVEDDANILLGSNLLIMKNTNWHFRPQAVVKIGDNCKFEATGELVCGRKAEITIGDNTSVGYRYWIVAHTKTRIQIGKDCTFSRDVIIRTNDGHSIFDIATGKNINSAINEQSKKSVIIHDHVWIGAKCSCLYNTRVHSGSIVGAHSLLKKEYPNNCIIAGQPARIIRQDIAWAHENAADDINIIKSEYIRQTTER